ncbi:hypothetical protein MSAN_01434100 [Mycena sanguinolenta]|uniref:DUF6593 domain-containing protein n=1 Tax=Mycena sanguinolenta TaxID=230812 RepID=A0A8H6YA15_9AGAR|nr:hypothetical protein MSAN_01434100 [Mycena sanguinolenta]
MSTNSNDTLSWTNQDPRESVLFNSWGIMYRFQTTVSASGQSVTTLWRAIRANKEDRVAKLEWAANGGLGRVIIGKNTLPMADLVRTDPRIHGSRVFNGPDGLQYRWRPSSNNTDIVVSSHSNFFFAGAYPDLPTFFLRTFKTYQLQDSNGVIIAFFRPTRQTRYQIGDVYGELHFIRTAGSGTVMHPPIMDTVTVTAMLYRFCSAWNL